MEKVYVADATEGYFDEYHMRGTTYVVDFYIIVVHDDAYAISAKDNVVLCELTDDDNRIYISKWLDDGNQLVIGLWEALEVYH